MQKDTVLCPLLYPLLFLDQLFCSTLLCQAIGENRMNRHGFLR